MSEEIKLEETVFDANHHPLTYAVYEDWLKVNQDLLADGGQVDIKEVVGAVDTKFRFVMQALARLEGALNVVAGKTLTGIPVLEDGQLVIAVKEAPDAEGPDVITL